MATKWAKYIDSVQEVDELPFAFDPNSRGAKAKLAHAAKVGMGAIPVADSVSSKRVPAKKRSSSADKAKVVKIVTATRGGKSTEATVVSIDSKSDSKRSIGKTTRYARIARAVGHFAENVANGGPAKSARKTSRALKNRTKAVKNKVSGTVKKRDVRIAAKKAKP